jgi:hypothetical protein
MRTAQDMGLWCEVVTDALTRYHVTINMARALKRKKASLDVDKASPK